MQAALSRAQRLLPRALPRAALPANARAAGLATQGRGGGGGGGGESEVLDPDVDRLAGLASGGHLRAAFAARAAAALRYDYLSQRAELEAELEAASTFRSLKGVAEQQALGFLELLEEYGSGSGGGGASSSGGGGGGDGGGGGEGMVIGTTLDNMASAAVAEKEDAERYRTYAEVASEEGLEQLSEWMGDMADAADRVSDRLEMVSSLMDDEFDSSDEGEIVMDLEEAAPADGKSK